MLGNLIKGILGYEWTKKGRRTMENQEFYATRDDIAPAFSADAVDGNQIRSISLEEYKGKWVMLFFYPSNFTAV